MGGGGLGFFPRQQKDEREVWFGDPNWSQHNPSHFPRVSYFSKTLSQDPQFVGKIPPNRARVDGASYHWRREELEEWLGPKPSALEGRIRFPVPAEGMFSPLRCPPGQWLRSERLIMHFYPTDNLF